MLACFRHHSQQASLRGRVGGTPLAAISPGPFRLQTQPPTPIIYRWRRCPCRLPLNNLLLVAEGLEGPRKFKIEIKAEILRSGESTDANILFCSWERS